MRDFFFSLIGGNVVWMDVCSGPMSDSVSPTSSAPFWEQFQTTVTSPMSTRSDVVFPSFDPASQAIPPKRFCVSWDASNVGDVSEEAEEEEGGRDSRTERQHTGGVASKPSETVSLRYGMASDSASSDALDYLSDDPSFSPDQ